MRCVRWVTLACLLAVGLAVPLRAAAQTDATLYTPVLDRLEPEIAAELEDTLSTYEVTATFTPAAEDDLATIDGELTLTYLNDTGGPLDELYFRLYPNVPEYDTGALTVDDLTVDGDPVQGELALDDTLLTVPLATPLPPDETTTVALSFLTTLPTDPSRSYGMFQYDSDSNIYSMAHWLPLLAGWTEEDGWKTGPTSENGDPVFTNAALFDVTLAAPDELIVATSGSPVEEATSGAGTTRYLSGPSRDFVMAASTDFGVAEATVGDTIVRSYYLADGEDAGKAVLDYGARSLALFNRLLGPYPFEEMDLVQVDLGNGAGGVEFPGLMYIGGDYYDLSPSELAQPNFLEVVTAHEVIHQWWYAVVGNDQYEHAFIDEGLTNYLTAVYFEEEYGEETGTAVVNATLLLPYLSMLFEEGDAIADQPTDDFESASQYGITIYSKAALGFQAIRIEIGDEAFYAALQQYYRDHAFEVATPEDLKAAFEEASGQELDELWRHWFEAAEGERDYDSEDLDELIRDSQT